LIRARHSLLAGLALAGLVHAQTTVTVPAQTVTVPVPAVTPPPVTPPPIVLSGNGQSITIQPPAVQPPAIPATTLQYTVPAYQLSATVTAPTTPMIGTLAPAGSPTSFATSQGTWTVLSGVVYLNGATYGYSLGVVLLVNAGGSVYQENGSCLWWVAGGTAVSPTWTSSSAPAGVTLPRCPVQTTSTTTSSGSTSTTSAPPATGCKPTGVFGIAVSGANLVSTKDCSVVQLRGVNISGLEAVAIQGWSVSDPWGGTPGNDDPLWPQIAAWGVNAVRIPLNEASWNGISCLDDNGDSVPHKAGQTVNADPGGNYRQTVQNTVTAANAAGYYVILDLHFSAPSPHCPQTQSAAPDSVNAVTFWASIAATFKNNPAVMYELFNEPFLDQTTITNGVNVKAALISGGAQMSNMNGQGEEGIIPVNWSNAGFQTLVNTIRQAGATGVILSSTLAYASDTGDWLQYHPTDPLNQLAAVWHAYPNGSSQTIPDCVGAAATCGPATMAAAKAIIAAGYPVVITEFGEGNNQSVWAPVLLPFADAAGISYFGWTFNNWVPQGSTSNVLISDANADPTTYGAYVKQHYLCRAAGTASCP